MGTTRSLVEFKHDTGYGDSLLLHINNAIAGKDMVALSAAELPDDPKEHQDTIPKPTGKFRNLRELRDEMASRVMPQIKPLVWEDVFRDDNHANIKAETTFGKFCITVVEAIGCYVSAAPFYNWPFKECKSEAEAKAWCQAEYERRIRECLE